MIQIQAVMLLLFVWCMPLVALQPADGDTKIDGISWVGQPQPVDAEQLQFTTGIGADWVALIPYGFARYGSTSLLYNEEWQWWGETKQGIAATTQLAHQRGMKVMIKPQVWVKGGSYVGHFKQTTEADWLAWEQNYAAFILDYAQLAQEQQAELFCIGTEWTYFVQERPQFWITLIGKVRQVYTGQITYASNWDAFDSVPFWGELDYVGVDAYFPLSKDTTPLHTALVKAWEPHAAAMQAVSQKACKPILFTEFGYRSTDFCAAEPWSHGSHNDKLNLTAQRNALEALFTRFWKEDWFAGGFLWNWYPNHIKAGGTYCTDFTPQNKPAEQVISRWYKP